MPYANVDDFINAQSPEAQPRLRELRSAIRAAVPEATEIISYDMPSYRTSHNIAYFSAAKAHVALYGTPLGDFEELLEGYETSGKKGTLRFPLDKPIPEELVRTLTLASAERAASRGKKKA